MKKLLLILIVPALAIQTAGAQIKLGVRGSVMTSLYEFNELTIDNTLIRPVGGSQIGYQLGIVTRLTIPKLIHIQPELNFSSRDYAFTLTNGGNYYPDGRVNVRRLEMPVTAGFNIGPLRFFSGPVFILSSTQECNTASSHKLDIQFSDSDIALLAGVGIDANNFFVDIRYTTYRNKSSATYSIYNNTRKVRSTKDFTIQYSIGFFF